MITVWKKSLVIVIFTALSSEISAAPLDLANTPLTVSTTTQPNVMLLLDNSISMRSRPAGVLVGPTKIETVKQVAKNVIAAQPSMNFGLAVFGYWNDSGMVSAKQGGTVLEGCKNRSEENTSSVDSIYQSIDNIQADTWTPLSEALYEVTRYYRGLPTTSAQTVFPAHADSGQSSPIEFRCQKNFTVVLTDGLPTSDNTFPDNDPADIADNTKSLPDWDNNAVNDGLQRGIKYELTAGETLFLDDVALFGYEIDFKTTGVDLTGKSFNDPDFTHQNMSTYTIGFDVSADMLRDAAFYGHGEYYQANDTSTLQLKLSQALESIVEKSASSSSLTTNSGRLNTGSYVYQGRFNSVGWGGQLLSFAMDADKESLTYGDVLTNGAADQGSVWEAGSKLPEWDERNIFTNDINGAAGGAVFGWEYFSFEEQDAFFDSDSQILDYIRGRMDLDESLFRKRISGLGDIVHSTPYYVGKPSARYLDSIQPTRKYSDFVSSHSNRKAMLYVGANDGMLHGFDANTGIEQVAFIPNAVLPELKKLSYVDYSHHYFVDGSPTIVDAFVDSEWRSVLVGGLNRGGQGIYLLNVTDPDFFTENQINANNFFMWEFTDKDDPELGYSYSRPKIVKLRDGNWYAIFGNGFNNTTRDNNVSTTGDAVIFIVNLADKTKRFVLSTKTGMAEDPLSTNRPNGFASVTPVDLDGDQITDHLYAGDLFGNVWKFTLDHTDPAKWALEYKLFETCYPDCSSLIRQPITAALTVGRSLSGQGQMVYFGTGKYLETEDNNGASGGIQTFYAVHDQGGYSVSSVNSALVSREQLQQQTITNQHAFSVLTDVMKTPDNSADDVAVSFELRETSNNIATQSNNGWFLDLVYGTETGERIVTAPALRAGQIVFVTNVPDDDPCAPGGDSWIMKLDAFSGKRLTHTYDVNGDGRFTAADRPYANGKNASTGMKVNSGNTPAFMPDGDADKILISTHGGIKVVDSYLGQQVNRQSWQQLIH